MAVKNILGLVLVIFLVFCGFFFFRTQNFSPSKSVSQTVSQIQKTLEQPADSMVSAVPAIAFQELTIPFLRSKTYESELTELKKYQEQPVYTSYLTSYLSDTLKINGLITQPKGEMPEGGWPAIVFVHGYIPPSQYSTTEKYAAYVDYLARNGFVVFKIDLRGHGDSEGEPSGAYMSGDYIIDTLNAYAALESTSFVNSKKIGLWGHSMAGNVVMRSWAVKPEIPAVVVWAGAVYSYTDQQKYGIDDNSYQPPANNAERQKKRQELMALYGQPSEESEFWKKVAPTNYLNELQGAIQLNHAVDDTVVNIGYSRDLNALLDATSVRHELNEYSAGGHNISGANFSKAMTNTVTFFKTNLGK